MVPKNLNPGLLPLPRYEVVPSNDIFDTNKKKHDDRRPELFQTTADCIHPQQGFMVYRQRKTYLTATNGKSGNNVPTIVSPSQTHALSQLLTDDMYLAEDKHQTPKRHHDHQMVDDGTVTPKHYKDLVVFLTWVT
jgi:hypothetical protein